MSKPYKSYDDLLSFLQNDKNLIIHDIDTAKHILTKTSYFSLISGYKDNFKNTTTGKYIDGTTFEDIYHLYQFDNELRAIFLKYILMAERSIKSSLAYHFSAIYGDEQNQYVSYFPYQLSKSTEKGIQKLIDIFNYHLYQNNNYAYINHYKHKYHNIPLWIMIQVLTLGQVSHMFDYLKASVPIKICNDHHHISRKDMHSFLSLMTKHRNVCAHGDRFFNYVTKDSITNTLIHKKLHIPQINDRYQCGKNDIFSEVIILKYLLDTEDFRSFYYELKHCITKLQPDKSILQIMGFPEYWTSILQINVNI
jgi:abortive infection bacteriophage resistance protein